jgi:hypothetical protein
MENSESPEDRKSDRYPSTGRPWNFGGQIRGKYHAEAEAAKQQARVEGFADEFSAILSRQIDEHIGS